MNKLRTFTVLVILITGSGCAVEEKQRIIQKPEPHPHRYPFTEVTGNYHVRLEVDHAKGKMLLLFEDISEEPVRLLRLKRIKGKVVLPDGIVKIETFRPWPHLHRKRTLRRGAGRYVARGKWIKTTPAFILNVKVHLKGHAYELTFNYEIPGGKIPP
jgi:hypothetical protein